MPVGFLAQRMEQLGQRKSGGDNMIDFDEVRVENLGLIRVGYTWQ